MGGGNFMGEYGLREIFGVAEILWVSMGGKFYGWVWDIKWMNMGWTKFYGWRKFYG